MKVLELFFGNGSFSRAYLDLGFEIVGLGIDPCPEDLKDKITYHQMDVLRFLGDTKYKRGDFNIIWASPPCETYSVAALSQRIRTNCIAVTEKARLHDSYVLAALDIIEALEPEFYIIENPRACLRKQPFMQGIPRVTITYCQYGKKNMKPTDLFGNLPSSFIPKCCKNGDPCHVKRPRGSKHNRDSTVPYDLCLELAIKMICYFAV